MAEAVIEPFFFGAAPHPIFGTFHPSREGSARALTLICPPLFSDYIRTHFVLRQLAIALSARGHDVLRIDYRGTGDSFGDLSDLCVSDWICDIGLALREGLALSGNSTVRVAGVRAGALLAAKALSQQGTIDRFVFWDPVADGREHLGELGRIRQTMLGRTLVSPADRAQAEQEYAGYRLSGVMIEEIETLSREIYAAIPKNRLYLVETTGDRTSAIEGHERHHVACNCDWSTESEDQLLAKPVLERLVSCLTTP